MGNDSVMVQIKTAEQFLEALDRVAIGKMQDDARRNHASNQPHVMDIAYLAKGAGLKVEKVGHLTAWAIDSSRGAIQIHVIKEQYQGGKVPVAIQNILLTELDVRGRSAREVAYRNCLLNNVRLENPSQLEQLLVDSSLEVPEMSICVEDEPEHFGEFLVLDAAHRIGERVEEYGAAKCLVKKENYVIGEKGRNYFIVLRTKTAGNTLAVVADLSKKVFRIDYVHKSGFAGMSFEFGERPKARDEAEKLASSAIGILETYLRKNNKL